jgi:CubicO group peptidase (beta-lactamase class C family)
MGGGMQVFSRDFMKFAQLMLNGGTWGKHRVISQEWVKRSVSPLVEIGRKKRSKYGYLWWLIDYPYQGQTVHGFYAGGNGGQVVMGIPELDLAIAFTGGNYNDMVMFDTQRRFIPELVLPAVIGK